ncbi:MAG: phosphate signaling complex protein PhoU [Oscillospiraceae bacterium]|nr:phosphate signaling complex protein PhoU [Oscillospiraceae bacterium]
MRENLLRQLELLNNELIEMGALCEDAIASAVKYLSTADNKLLDNAAEAERQIDRQEREIEDLCMKLIIREQPVATDLRVISSALRMTSDMERIGDQAFDISDVAKNIAPLKVGGEIQIYDMAEATVRMVTESVNSFVTKDVAAAKAVIAMDDVVDRLFDAVKNELIAAIESKSGKGEFYIDLLMIAKYFERIGDHAVNIAEWVIYSVTGSHKA